MPIPTKSLPSQPNGSAAQLTDFIRRANDVNIRPAEPGSSKKDEAWEVVDGAAVKEAEEWIVIGKTEGEKKMKK
jgi:hypothetical protein